MQNALALIVLQKGVKIMEKLSSHQAAVMTWVANIVSACSSLDALSEGNRKYTKTIIDSLYDIHILYSSRYASMLDQKDKRNKRAALKLADDFANSEIFGDIPPSKEEILQAFIDKENRV